MVKQYINAKYIHPHTHKRMNRLAYNWPVTVSSNVTRNCFCTNLYYYRLALHGDKRVTYVSQTTWFWFFTYYTGFFPVASNRLIIPVSEFCKHFMVFFCLPEVSEEKFIIWLQTSHTKNHIKNSTVPSPRLYNDTI